MAEDLLLRLELLERYLIDEPDRAATITEALRVIAELEATVARLRSENEHRESHSPLSIADTQRLLGSDTPISIGTVPTDPLGMRAVPSLVRERLRCVSPPVDFWRCTSCGCFWRDNHNDSVSLANANERSCIQCEANTPTACEPLARLRTERAALEATATRKPEPDSAEWWRQVAQGLSIKLHDAEIVIQAREATIHMAAARLGGLVEDQPTGSHNFLQRIDALVALEATATTLRTELDEALEAFGVSETQRLADALNELADLRTERDELQRELTASLNDDPGKRGYVHVPWCNNARAETMPGTLGVTCNCHPKLRAYLRAQLVEKSAIDPVVGAQHSPNTRDERSSSSSENLAAEGALSTLRKERIEALKILATQSGDDLLDACRQVKQVAISEADNSDTLENERNHYRDADSRAREELVRVCGELDKAEAELSALRPAREARHPKDDKGST